MTVVGFNFIKFSAEKNKPIKGKIDIKNNVTIKDVSESKMAVDQKMSALKFDFLFQADYEPEIGKIEIIGETMVVLDKKIGEEALKGWKKEKKIKGAFMSGLLNHILAKCNIEAVMLSRDLNLPAPIPLPKVN